MKALATPGSPVSSLTAAQALENTKVDKNSAPAEKSGGLQLPSIASMVKYGGTLALLMSAGFIKGAEAYPMEPKAEHAGNSTATGHNSTELVHATAVNATQPTTVNHPTGVALPTEAASALQTFAAVAPSTSEVLHLEARNVSVISLFKLAGKVAKAVDKIDKMIDELDDISDDVKADVKDAMKDLEAELSKQPSEITHDAMIAIVLSMLEHNDLVKKSDLSESDKKEISEAIASEVLDFTNPGETGAGASITPQMALTGAAVVGAVLLNL